MWVDVEINIDFLFEGGFEFSFQRFNKFTYPPVALVVFLAVADENLPAGRQVSYS
jgi:hypothetical protein